MMHGLFRFVLRCCHAVLLFLALACSMALLALLVHVPLVHVPLQERLLAALPDLLSSREQAPWLMAVAMGLLLIVLLAAWMEVLLRRRPPPVLTFNTVEGTVSIATATLARFVRQVIQGSRGVVNARVDTLIDGRKMAVTAQVRFTDEQAVTVLATEAQRTVRQRVQAVFGCDLLRDIKIEVASVDIRAGRPRRLLSWRAEAEPSPPPPAVTGT